MFIKYLERTNSYSPIRYILELSITTLIIKGLLLTVTDQIFILAGLEFLVEISEDLQVAEITLTDFIFGVILAPPIETIIGQWLPMLFASLFLKATSQNQGANIPKILRVNKWKLIIFSSAVFALIHWPSIAFFPGAFIVGIMFSWIFLEKRKFGWGKAFFYTTTVHALHNFIAFLLGAIAQ